MKATTRQMRPADLIEARRQLGLTQSQLGTLLQLGKGAIRTVRRWEHGERAVPGPVAVAVRAMLAGYRPEGWPNHEPRLMGRPATA